MKKILILLLMLSVAIFLGACTDNNQTGGEVVPEHTHTYTTKWTSDETHHWHKANCQHTDIISEKEEHTFDEGVVTKEPTTKEEGKMTYTCTVCGYSKEEDMDKVEQTSFAYTAYNANGTEIASSDNIWNAIINARDKSKSSNKCYVLRNSDGEQVYKYSTKNYYCYRADEYVETKTSESTAISWGKKYEDSYVMNGQATEFVYVGKKIDTKYGYNKDSVYGIENQSGPYGFLYGKEYYDCPNGIGYTYIEFEVRLSEARIKYFDDKSNEKCWNAYVFANFCMSNPWITCDIGIMNLGGEKDGDWTPGGWVPCFNYKSTNYNSSQSMTNPLKHGGIVSQMHYNKETGYYENGDDLKITCYIWLNNSNGKYYFVLNIKNLNPDTECFNMDKESPLYGTREWEALYEIPEATVQPKTAKLLLAASNCPVAKSGDFWNPLCGNAFENVVFRNMKVAQWGSHGTKTEYGYNHVAFDYALTMGADNCFIKHGTDSEGQYFIIDMRNYN